MTKRTTTCVNTDASLVVLDSLKAMIAQQESTKQHADSHVSTRVSSCWIQGSGGAAQQVSTNERVPSHVDIGVEILNAQSCDYIGASWRHMLSKCCFKGVRLT